MYQNWIVLKHHCIIYAQFVLLKLNTYIIVLSIRVFLSELSCFSYNLLQASPLYTRLSKLEEILKGDISRLFKLVRQSTHVSAPIGMLRVIESRLGDNAIL